MHTFSFIFVPNDKQTAKEEEAKQSPAMYHHTVIAQEEFMLSLQISIGLH